MVVAILAFASSVNAQTAPPTLTTISPTSGVRGETVNISLTGTNFVAGLTIDAGPGITASSIAVTNSTTATADLSIASNASLGGRNLTVTTANGTSGPRIFTVLPLAPALTGINPFSAVQGTTVNVVLSGTNFVVGMTVAAGEEINVRNLSIASSTSANATFVVSASATIGPRDITVTTPGGTSGSVVFDIIAAPGPTLTGITPNRGVVDSSVTVTLTGTNFLAGMSVDTIEGITVSSVAFVSSTQATAVFAIASDAALGDRSVTVTTGGGTSGPVNFTVGEARPTLTGINPASGNPGATIAVTLTGSNFTNALTIDTIAGITITNVKATSSTSATASFAIEAAAEPGPRAVTVTTPGGTTDPVAFAVNPGVPTLTAIDPAAAIVGTGVRIALTGTNFYAGLTVNAGDNVTVSDIVVLSTTAAEATLLVGANAAIGERSVTVTTPGGTTTGVTFTVIPLAPTLTGISPSSIAQNNLARSFTVTLTGTHLFGPTIAISGTGVTAPAGVNSVSSTTATAVLTVEADAPLGPRDVTLTTAGGTTGAIQFTVVPAAPTVTGISPAIGLKGASVNVTLTGSNFVSGSTTVNTIAGVTVTNTTVVNATALTATFVVAANAQSGARNVTVSTGQGTSPPAIFTVADPFPDVSITSSHTGRFGVGYNEPFTVAVTNVGAVPTSGVVTVRDTLPAGLTFVSGAGSGWACSAAGQVVTCTNSAPIASSASSSFTLTVAVSPEAAPGVNHVVAVTASGDINSANDSFTDSTVVAATPTPTFVFGGPAFVAGEQTTLSIRIPSSFPHDVTGSVTMTFTSSAVIPLDDPAIQFASGGRTVTFTIPANGTQARMGTASEPGTVAFQTGTVAGRFNFAGSFTAGTFQGTFVPSQAAGVLSIPLQAPTLQSVTTSTQGGFSAALTISSPSREVTELSLTFDTTPAVRLNCGTVSGCSVSGNTITLDVSSFFRAWFTSDRIYGGLSLLRLPLSISGGSVKGSVSATLRNNQGFSNSMSFSLPGN